MSDQQVSTNRLKFHNLINLLDEMALSTDLTFDEFVELIEEERSLSEIGEGNLLKVKPEPRFVRPGFMPSPGLASTAFSTITSININDLMSDVNVLRQNDLADPRSREVLMKWAKNVAGIAAPGFNSNQGTGSSNTSGGVTQPENPSSGGSNARSFVPMFEEDHGTLNFSMDINFPVMTQAPYHVPTDQSSPLALKQVAFNFYPSRNIPVDTYFSNALIPNLIGRAYSQQRFSANVENFITLPTVVEWLNRTMDALSYYHFYSNVYAYTSLYYNENPNSAIHYIREKIFQTGDLEYLDMLKIRLNGFPVPQTMENFSAWFFGIYATSTKEYSSCYMNVPYLFADQVPFAKSDKTAFTQIVESGQIKNVIARLNGDDLPDTVEPGETLSRKVQYKKFIGYITNFFPEYINSTVGSYFVKPVYDATHHSDFINSNIYRSVIGEAHGSLSVYPLIPSPYDSPYYWSFDSAKDFKGLLAAIWSGSDLTNNIGFCLPAVSRYSETLFSETFAIRTNLFYFEEQTSQQDEGFVDMYHPRNGSHFCKNFGIIPAKALDGNKNLYNDYWEDTAPPHGTIGILNVNLDNIRQAQLDFIAKIMDVQNWFPGQRSKPRFKKDRK